MINEVFNLQTLMHLTVVMLTVQWD